MDDKAIIRSFESGFDKRVIALTIAVVLAVIGLVVYVVHGFKGHDASKAATVLTPPNVETVKPPPAPAR
jgi:hypothetical protein